MHSQSASSRARYLPDPLLDVFEYICHVPLPSSTYHSRRSVDPMVHESMMVPSRLSYSPDGAGSGPISPVYVPSWMTVGDGMGQSNGPGLTYAAATNAPPSSDFGPSDATKAALGSSGTTGHEVCFGPGVQLQPTSVEVEAIASQVCSIDISGELVRSASSDEEADCRAFIPVPPALMPARKDRQPEARREVAPEGKRSSKRLAARSCSVPVAHRAQHRLIRELAFVAPGEPVRQDAVDEFIQMYKKPVAKGAVLALRRAARLNDAAAGEAMAAVAASGAAGMGTET